MIKIVRKFCNGWYRIIFKPPSPPRKTLGLLAGFIFICAPLDAGTLFSYAEWEEIAAHYSCSEDFIALTDGHKLCGTVEKLPPIDFTFGRVTFTVEEVATVSLEERQGKLYVQYITHSGHSYFGPVAKTPFRLKDRELAPTLVSFMVLKKRVTNQPLSSLFTLILKDGQQLPVHLTSEPIVLSDGLKEKPLNPEDIVEICCEEELKGTLLQGDLHDHFGLVFLKERFLTFATPKVTSLIKMPWRRVASLQKGQNGFKSGQKPNPVEVELPKPIPKRSIKVDSIGNSGGNALVGATGDEKEWGVKFGEEPPALFDPKEEFADLEVKFEEEPQALFDPKEEWADLEVKFGEEPPALFDPKEEFADLEVKFGEEPPALFDPKEEFADLEVKFEEEPPALFDPKEEWADSEVKFEEEPSEEVAELDPSELQQIAEKALFENLPKEHQEPESFELTPEAKERIAEVLAEDDLDDLIHVSPSNPRVEAFWEDLLKEEDEDELVWSDGVRETEQKALDLLVSDGKEDEENVRTLMDQLFAD